jgi:hypothetical protein
VALASPCCFSSSISILTNGYHFVISWPTLIFLACSSLLVGLCAFSLVSIMVRRVVSRGVLLFTTDNESVTVGSSAETIALITIGSVLLVSFVVFENYTTRSPIIPPRLFHVNDQSFFNPTFCNLSSTDANDLHSINHIIFPRHGILRRWGKPYLHFFVCLILSPW